MADTTKINVRVRWCVLSSLVMLLPACSNDGSGFQASANAATPAHSEPAVDPITRGEYVARIGGCNDCHTPGYPESGGQVPTSQWLVGSPLGWNGPWGTTYAANLRLKLHDMDEATWMTYSANLHTRPPMPDFQLRAMNQDDRRDLYRFIHALGAAGQPAPAYLPPGTQPPIPYVQWVLPPPSQQTSTAQKPPAKH